MKPHIRLTRYPAPGLQQLRRWVCYIPVKDDRKKADIAIAWGFGSTPEAAFRDQRAEAAREAAVPASN